MNAEAYKSKMTLLSFYIVAHFSRGLLTRENRKITSGTSLVAQWLRIHLPMQGTWVRSLVWEDPTCCGATKPLCHNYWACALEPTSHNYWACALEPTSHNYWACTPQLLKPMRLEPMLSNKRSHCNEKPAYRNEEQPPLATKKSLQRKFRIANNSFQMANNY